MSLPKNGCDATLNASAENGSVGVGLRVISISSSPGSWPIIGGTSSGRREVVDDGVEHGLDALVLERGAAQHRVDLAGDGELRMPALISATVSSSPSRYFSMSVVVALGDALDELVAVLLGLRLQVGRDVLDRRSPHRAWSRRARRSAFIVTRSTTPMKSLSEPIGSWIDQRRRAEAVDDRLHGEVEVRAELVHLVDEADARDVVLVGLAPDRLGLGLDALLAVEHGDGAVEDAQGALHLDGEVDVAGGVDDVDLVVLPEASSSRRT